MHPTCMDRVGSASHVNLNIFSLILNSLTFYDNFWDPCSSLTLKTVSRLPWSLWKGYSKLNHILLKRRYYMFVNYQHYYVQACGDLYKPQYLKITPLSSWTLSFYPFFPLAIFYLVTLSTWWCWEMLCITLSHGFVTAMICIFYMHPTC